jgi:DNA (cytosine-5)-methyltransferase 1
MLRVIRDVKPTWVVGENVLGLVNWNDGLVFNEVQADLEAEGYEVQPFILPAASVNAPHKRDRVWFVAYKNAPDTDSLRHTSCGEGTEAQGIGCGNNGEQKERSEQTERANGLLGLQPNATDTEGLGRGWRGSKTSSKRQDIVFESGSQGLGNGGIAPDTEMPRQSTRIEGSRQIQLRGRDERISISNNWQVFPTQSPVCGGDDGFPNELDGITFPKWRNESIKAYGNAIVPQVAYQIFKAINEYNDL